MKHRILLIEDSPDVAEVVRRGLGEEGFDVHVASSGALGLRKAAESWDLILLDLMLPDVPGESILRFLRQKLDSPPVIVLTAKGELADKVSLFESGCDDYVTKPFAFEELLGRVRAVLRRPRRRREDQLDWEGLHLDPENHMLSVGSHRVELTPKESAILRILLSPPDRVVTRKELLEGAWGLHFDPKTNVVEVHLAHLRRKLAELGRADWLQTVRGSGFAFRRRPGISDGL